MTTIEQYIDNPDAAGDTEPATCKEVELGEALRAVAELHSKTLDPYDRVHPEKCDACLTIEDRFGDAVDADYPCLTRQVIHAALGIDGKDQT